MSGSCRRATIAANHHRPGARTDTRECQHEDREEEVPEEGGGVAPPGGASSGRYGVCHLSISSGLRLGLNVEYDTQRCVTKSRWLKNGSDPFPAR